MMPTVHRTPLGLTLIAIGALLAACAAPGSPESRAPVPSAGASDGGAAQPSAAAGEVPEGMLAQAIADAASGAGVDISAVGVLSAEAVTWSDGSIGCPQPDQMYTQALVPGYRVVLDVDGEEMSFHASQDGEFTYCADPQPPVDDGTVDR